MSNLDRDLEAMKRLGYTSYGKYKLDYPNTNKPSQKPKKQMKRPPQFQYERNCACCGTPFVTTRVNRLYCSEPCKIKMGQQRYRGNKKEKRGPLVAKCEICGAEFVQIRASHKYCCKECHDEGGRRMSRLWRQRLKEAKNGISV